MLEGEIDQISGFKDQKLKTVGDKTLVIGKQKHELKPTVQTRKRRE